MKLVPQNWFDQNHLYHPIAWYLFEHSDELSDDAFDTIVKQLQDIHDKIENELDKPKNPDVKLQHQIKELEKVIAEQNVTLQRATKAFSYIKKKDPALLEKAYKYANSKKETPKKKSKAM
jgi:SMC interacting uncharacterized protein involved in chromosome segregation